MNQKNTLRELKNFCTAEQCVGALMLTGEWGCGKTYLLEHVLKNEPEIKDTICLIRVSLFGITETNQIHEAVKQAWQSSLLEENNLKIISELASKAKKITTAVQSVIPNRLKTAIDKVTSIDLLSLVEIEKKLGEKRIILVFDDLERCKVDVVDVLGTINEYCENKGIRTIIVANQEKIEDREGMRYVNLSAEVSERGNLPAAAGQFGVRNRNDSKTSHIKISIPNDRKTTSISYSEIKEKIIQRTIYYQPLCREIIDGVLESMELGDSDNYKTFIEANKEELVELVDGYSDIPEAGSKSEQYEDLVIENNSQESTNQPAGLHNIRILKCAIHDFHRVYTLLNKAGIENLNTWFINFAYVFYVARNGFEANPDDEITELDLETKKIYPDFHEGYVLRGVKEWITKGDWDEESVQYEIDRICYREQELKPVDMLRTNSLAFLDENVIEKGWQKYIEVAYSGELTLNDYVQLIRNSYWAHEFHYNLPSEIEWERVYSGIQISIHRMEAAVEEGREAFDRDWLVIEDDIDSLNESEKKAYQMIREYRDQEGLMYHKNRSSYISMVSADPMSAVMFFRSRRFDMYTEEMATATGEAYEKLNNYDKAHFAAEFRRLWNLSDFQSNKLDLSIRGYEKLRGMLENLKESYASEQKKIAQIHTETFMSVVDAYLKTLIARKQKEDGNLLPHSGQEQQVLEMNNGGSLCQLQE